MSSEYGKSILPGKICKKRSSSCHFTSPIDNFPCDITRVRKFDYYSADHTWGAATCSKCIAVYGENPTTHAFLLVTPPVRSPHDKFGPVYRVKRVLSAAACYIPVRPSLIEIQPLQTHRFFSERNVYAACGLLGSKRLHQRFS